jgi:hypothetical protein
MTTTNTARASLIADLTQACRDAWADCVEHDSRAEDDYASATEALDDCDSAVAEGDMVTALEAAERARLLARTWGDDSFERSLIAALNA